MQEKQGNDMKREDVKPQTSALAPCPYCGEAKRMRMDDRSIGVRCLVCGFTMELVLDTERLIRQAWNREPGRTA